MSTKRYAVCVLGLAASAFLLLYSIPPRVPGTAPARIALDSSGIAPRRTLTPASHRAMAYTAPLHTAIPFSMPLTFEPTRGLSGPGVQFVGRGKGITAFLTRKGIEVAIPPHEKSPSQSGVVRIRLEEGRELHWKAKEKLRGESNYFLGNDPRQWRTHVPHFARAEATNAISGDAIVAYGNDEGLEFDLRLRSADQIGKLRLEISGGSAPRLDSDGNLTIRAGGNELRLRRPGVYQKLAHAKQRRLNGAYVLEANGTIGFRIGPHDPAAPLIVDPSLSVSYSTFLGGAGEDRASSLALDSSGKVYMGGTTTSAATFPEQGAHLLGPNGGPSDLFIAKIDPAASGANSLVYLTFLGGTGAESGGLIAVDGAGDIAVTGVSTSTDFPVTDGSQRTAGSNDATISELDPSGGKLLFSTLFGGSGAESTREAGGIAFDNSGDIFIASDTSSTDLHTTAGALQSSYGGGISDGFLAVFVPAAPNHLKYSTYLGINAAVAVTGLAADTSGEACLAGYTSDPGTSFPAKNAFQGTYAGGPFDAFVIKIRPIGQGAADLAFATLLGGGNADQAFGIAVDAATPATVYVTGATQSINFPTNGLRAPFQASLKGIENGFLAVVSQDPKSGMTSLAYSSYLGGSEHDAGLSVKFAVANAVYLAGRTTSADFPWLDNFQPLLGDTDAFLAKLDPTSSGAASLIYATPLAGTAPPGVAAEAQGNAVVADASGHVYLAGETTAADFPRAGNPGNGLQPTCASCQQSPPLSDAFLAAIGESAMARPAVSFNVPNVNFGAQSVGSPNVPPLFAALFNTGDAPLNITGLSVTGVNSSDFSVSNGNSCTAGPISPGGMCAISVTYTPKVVGPEQAFVNFADDAPGSPQVLELKGIGSGALAVPFPPSLNFGNQPQGSTSNGRTMTLSNNGNQNLHISQFALGGPDAVQFLVQNATCTNAASVPPGGSCLATVAFAPAATGSFHAEIDIVDDSGGVTGSQQTVPLTGTGIPPAPVVNLAPGQLGFADQAVETSSAAQTVTLTNTGSAALNITSIGFDGADSANFEIVPGGASPCPVSGGTVGIGANCTVAVAFAPQSRGAKSANLDFHDDAAGSPQAVALSGKGVAPVIQLSPASINFMGQTVGTTSAAQSVALSNTGDAPLGINSITLSGPNPGDFSQTNDCPPSVGVGNNCLITAKFQPLAAGNRAAAISISDNAAGSPHTVSLAGNGTQPGVSLSPASINFASQLAGTSSSPVNVTVTNSGAGVLIISKISFAGNDPADFKETDNCSAKINPNGTCTIQVVFLPAAAGARSASLELVDNAPNTPQSVALAGTAEDFSIDPSAAGGTSATVMQGQPANYQLQAVSTNGFSGTVSLACTGAPSEAVCTPTPQNLSISANSPAALQVNVTTAAPALLWPHHFPRATDHPGRRVPLLLLLLAALLSFWLVGLRHRRLNTARFVRVALVVGCLVIMAACGGGGSSNPAVNPGTPPGTYALTVTASINGTNRSLALSLTVQTKNP